MDMKEKMRDVEQKQVQTQEEGGKVLSLQRFGL